MDQKDIALVPSYIQCCGSGIRFFLSRDLGWKKSGFFSHISKSFVKIFGLKILKFFVAALNPGSGAYFTMDPEWKNSDPG
jgi:hypothetical protein